MRLSVAEIADALRARMGADAPEWKEGEAGRVVTGLTWDSRAVRPGDLFACMPGLRVDGHDFADAAVEAGAAAVLAQRTIAVDAPVIYVDDIVGALGDIASCWRGHLEGTVVGLTGSTGKTTTKSLVREVLSRAGDVVATLANQNNEIGVPNTLLAADADTPFVIVEMGMRGLGQIHDLCAVARPEWGLVTNVGESHMELLGSRDNIAAAKAELYYDLPDGTGVAFVNAADDYAAWMCDHARLDERGVRAVFFEGEDAFPHVEELGIFEKARPFVWASDVELDCEGRPSFTMHARNFAQIGAEGADGDAACALALRGIHNVSNACSAAAVGLAAGMTLSQCCAALAEAQPEQGRQQVWHANGLTVVDDSYNANPDSMGASLRTFSAMATGGKRVAVLGDMLELGDASRGGHERMGRLAAQLGIDELICVGPLSRDMAACALEEGMAPESVHTFDDAAGALAGVRALLGEGDAVLVKASHSIGLEAVVEGLVK